VPLALLVAAAVAVIPGGPTMRADETVWIVLGTVIVFLLWPFAAAVGAGYYEPGRIAWLALLVGIVALAGSIGAAGWYTDEVDDGPEAARFFLLAYAPLGVALGALGLRLGRRLRARSAERGLSASDPRL
jgi:hypothetical protein